MAQEIVKLLPPEQVDPALADARIVAETRRLFTHDHMPALRSGAYDKSTIMQALIAAHELGQERAHAEYLFSHAGYDGTKWHFRRLGTAPCK